MSAIPLSVREGHCRTLSGDEPEVDATADSSDLDQLIDRVADTIASRGTRSDRPDRLLDTAVCATGGDGWCDLKQRIEESGTARERGIGSPLDQALKVAVDRCAGQEAASLDFHQSRPWREALDRRYGGRVAIGDLLESFAQWHERLQEAPASAADSIAAAYLEQPLHASHGDAPVETGAAARQPRAADQSPDRTSGHTPDHTPGHTLDRVLGAAIDQHSGAGDREQQAFAASARHRQALKFMFPGLSFTEACRRVVMLDGELHKDPIGTAARLAMSYGLPSDPLPSVHSVETGTVDDVHQLVASAAAQLPGFAELEDDVLAVLHSPEFLHGPDLQQNLSRAYQIAKLARRESASAQA